MGITIAVVSWACVFLYSKEKRNGEIELRIEPNREQNFPVSVVFMEKKGVFSLCDSDR
jgi:hypothetical protein